MNMLRNMIKRVLITKSGSDDTEFPVQQVAYNGNTADVEIISPYGLHANISASGESLGTMFAVEGQDDYRVVMAYTPTLRPMGLAEGEVVLYHPITKSQVYFRNNGDIDIETTGTDGDINITTNNNINIETTGADGDLNIKTKNDINITIEGEATITSVGDISITAPNLNIEGDVNIEGNLGVTGTSTASDHDSDGISGKTHTHGGVQTGAGSTGVPQ